MSRAALIRRVRLLTRLLDEAYQRSDLCADTIVPYTIQERVRVGDTIMVRVPKKFVPR